MWDIGNIAYEDRVEFEKKYRNENDNSIKPSMQKPAFVFSTMKNPESMSTHVFNAVIISLYLRWTVAITPVASFNPFRSPLMRKCVSLIVDFNAKRYSTRSGLDNRDR